MVFLCNISNLSFCRVFRLRLNKIFSMAEGEVITIVPLIGRTVKDITVVSGGVTLSDEHTFVMPANDVTIEITYEEGIEPGETTEPGPGETVEPS